MTQTPFDLDRAIDDVARQLTYVEPDPHLSARIALSLPTRSTWSLQWWAPRLAAIALVVAAGILWANRAQQVTHDGSPLASADPIATPTALIATVREAEPNRTPPLETVEPLEPLELVRGDFDGSLPAIETLGSLALEPLAPSRLAEDAPLTVAPLALADLPLAGEPISPQ